MSVLKRGAAQNPSLVQGSIARCILSFALPLFLGQLLQQLYNLADAWVLGNFAENEAFAAVSSGAVGPGPRLPAGFPGSGSRRHAGGAAYVVFRAAGHKAADPLHDSGPEQEDDKCYDQEFCHYLFLSASERRT